MLGLAGGHFAYEALSNAESAYKALTHKESMQKVLLIVLHTQCFTCKAGAPLGVNPKQGHPPME